MVVMLSSGLLIMQGGLWVKIAGVIYFLIMVAIMAVINSKDPFFFQILWRYKSYQDFYPNIAMHPGRRDKPNNF